MLSLTSFQPFTTSIQLYRKNIEAVENNKQKAEANWFEGNDDCLHSNAEL